MSFQFNSFWEISLLLEMYVKCMSKEEKEEEKKNSKAIGDSSTNEKKERKTVT